MYFVKRPRGISLGPDAKVELHQRHPDAHHPFLVKRMASSWFSAELVRIQPTELEFRVKGDAAYLALHDYVRSDGETTIKGGRRSDLPWKVGIVSKAACRRPLQFISPLPHQVTTQTISQRFLHLYILKTTILKLRSKNSKAS